VLIGPGETNEAETQAIAALVAAHLVRREEQRGATWFMLAHDRLIEPVRRANKKWREEHLSVLQAQAAMWEEQGRPDDVLLQGKPLKDAEAWAEKNKGGLTEVEEEFLQDSQNAAGARRARLRRLTVGISAVLAVTFAILSLVAGWSAFDANQQQKIAEAASTNAIGQRETAYVRWMTAEAANTKAIKQQATAEAASTKAIEEQDRYYALLGTTEAFLAEHAASPTSTPVLAVETPTPTLILRPTLISPTSGGPDAAPNLTLTPAAEAMPAPGPIPNPALTAAFKALQAQVADGRATQTAEAAGEVRVTQTAVARATRVADCTYEPYPEFRDLWESGSTQWRLGCPVQGPVDAPFAEQPFEHGFMFWHGEADSDLHFAVVADPGSRRCTTWYTSRSSPVDWDSTPERSCTPIPPAPELYVPIRGFGSLWCNHSGIREALGYATKKEARADSNILQEFDNGYMLLDSRKNQYVLFKDDSSCVLEPR
jgi:hypothetical protein